MSRDYLELGPAPSDETPQQVGTPEYSPSIARFECDLYRRVLRKQFGDEPREARLGIKSFPHDFGSYYEVVCYFDDQDETSMDYAFKLESEAPEVWPDWAKSELEQYKAEKDSEGRSEEAFASKKEKEKMLDNHPCPLCKGKKVGSCRCATPVEELTLEEVKRGHGVVCENGHRWGGSFVVDVEKKEKQADIDERKPKMMPGQEPYTEEELDKLYRMIDEGAEYDPGESGEIEKREGKPAQDDDKQLNLMDEMEGQRQDPGPAWMDLEGRPVRKHPRPVTDGQDETDALDEENRRGKKVTDEADSFISKKIRKLMGEGYEQKQAIAIAYSMARAKGYKVPEKKKKGSEVSDFIDDAKELIFMAKEKIDQGWAKTDDIINEVQGMVQDVGESELDRELLWEACVRQLKAEGLYPKGKK